MIEIGTLLALIGCFVTLATWLASRDKRAEKKAEKEAQEAKWQGNVSGKLDAIQNSVTGVNQLVARLDDRVDELTGRMVRVEESTKSAHHRLDEMSREERK